MKLFTKVTNGLKAVTYKVHKENAYTFSIKIIPTCLVVFYYYYYYYPGVAPVIKTHTQKKSYHAEKMTAPKSTKMCTVKLFA